MTASAGVPHAFGRKVRASGEPARVETTDHRSAGAGDYRTSGDAIEAATGLDLLNRIPAAVQAELEAGVDSGG